MAQLNLTSHNNPFARAGRCLVAGVAFLTLLAACGGGDGGGSSGGTGSGGTTPPVTPAPAPAPGTPVTTTGGTVTAAGVQMVVPADALSTTTTLAIEKSTIGAPASMPLGLAAIGDTYAITPHGTRFAVPVTVSLPIPAGRVLAADEQWMIAKANPGGSWVLQGNSVVNGNVVSTNVSSLSLFSLAAVKKTLMNSSPVAANGQPQSAPPSTPVTTSGPPFSLNSQNLTCVPTAPGAFCGFGKYKLKAQLSMNGGYLPLGCANPELKYRFALASAVVDNYPTTLPAVFDSLTSVALPLADGFPQSAEALSEDIDPSLYLPAAVRLDLGRGLVGNLQLFCGGSTTPAVEYQGGVSSNLGVIGMNRPEELSNSVVIWDFANGQPLSRSVVAGDRLTFKSLVQGGVNVGTTTFPIDVPAGLAPRVRQFVSGGLLTTDNGSITWQRSDDDGSSWNTIATGLQRDANSTPYGFSAPWVYWEISHSFTATLADNNALIRVVVCSKLASGVLPLKPADMDCGVSPSTRLRVTASALPPAITSAPESVLVRTGQAASFGAGASGVPTPTLQWQTRPADLSTDWTDIPNATATVYITDALPREESGRQYRVVATNSGGSIASPAATASVLDYDVPPSIVTHPGSLSVVSGSDAAFAVTATGTAPLHYQWFKGATPIQVASNATATSGILHLPGVTSADAGTYNVVVRNSAGPATSLDATLTVTPAAAAVQPVSITTQPTNLTVSAGNSATFAVAVNGSGPFSYQWRKGGVDIAGATSGSYTINSVSAGDVADYTVVVSNGSGSTLTSVTSAPAAHLTLASSILPPVQAPLITQIPSNVVATAGASATLAVGATGSPTISYEWRRDGTVVSTAGPVLVLSPVSNLDVGSYTVRVFNTAGSVDTTSTPASVTLLGSPVITAQPQNVTGFVSSTATFNVTATGQNLRYAWLRNGVEISGATSPSYTTPALTLGDSGAAYSVTVYNGSGVKFSSTATLTVNPAPPSALSYATPQSYTTGIAIAALSPSVTGTVTSYSVSPALPAGLSLNTTSGVFTGTPTVATTRATYTVTAQNGSGSTTFGLSLAVSDPVALAWGSTLTVALAGNVNSVLEADVASTPEGDTLVTWSESLLSGPGRLNSQRYSNATGLWLAQEVVGAVPPDTRFYRNPSLAAASTGRFAVTSYNTNSTLPRLAMAQYDGGDDNSTAPAWRNPAGFLATGTPSAGSLSIPSSAFSFDGSTYLNAWGQRDAVSGLRQAKAQAFRYDTCKYTTPLQSCTVPQPGLGQRAVTIASTAPMDVTLSKVAALGTTDFGLAWNAPDPNNSNGSTVYFSRFDGRLGVESWSTPVQVNTTVTGNAYIPSYNKALAGNSRGDAALAWGEENTVSSRFAFYLARYTTAGGWGAPERIDVVPANGTYLVGLLNNTIPELATGIDANGIVTVAWVGGIEGTGDLALHIRRCLPGTACGAPTVFNLTGRSASTPALVVSPNGDVTIVWRVDRPIEQQAVHYSAAAGTWDSAPTTIGSSTTDQPSLAADGLNRVTVVWRDSGLFIRRLE